MFFDALYNLIVSARSCKLAGLRISSENRPSFGMDEPKVQSRSQWRLANSLYDHVIEQITLLGFPLTLIDIVFGCIAKRAPNQEAVNIHFPCTVSEYVALLLTSAACAQIFWLLGHFSCGWLFCFACSSVRYILPGCRNLRKDRGFDRSRSRASTGCSSRDNRIACRLQRSIEGFVVSRVGDSAC